MCVYFLSASASSPNSLTSFNSFTPRRDLLSMFIAPWLDLSRVRAVEPDSTSVLQQERARAWAEQGVGVQRGEALLHVLRSSTRRAPGSRRTRPVRPLLPSSHTLSNLISALVLRQTGPPRTGTSTKSFVSGSGSQGRLPVDLGRVGFGHCNANASASTRWASR